MRPFSRLVGEMSTKSFITVSILFFINLINYMDRFTIAGVLEKVKTYYGMDNKQGGLLQTSFVVSYMIFAPIFGYLGDRYSRKYIMAGGVLFWSLTTYFGSLIPHDQKGWFFLMRGLVGVGEASYSTIAPTLIADLFVNEMRTKMLALFFFAIPVGSGLGYVVGSQMAAAFGSWQWSLRVTPPLGIISVLLVIFVLKEPARGEAETSPSTGDLSSSSDQPTNLSSHTASHSILQDLKCLSTNRSYIWSTAGFTCVCFAIGALSWWSADYMELAAKLSKVDISLEGINLIFGAITAAAGILGVILGSGGAQVYRHYNPRADPLLCAAGIFLSIPFSFLGLAVAHKTMSISWISIFLAVLFLCINWTLVADILLYVVPADKRAFAQSIQILVAHLLGDAFSPFMVGALNDAFKKDESPEEKYYSLQYALYSVSIVLVIGGLAFLYTAYFVIADKNTARMQMQGLHVTASTNIHTLPPGDRFDVNGVTDDSLQSFPPLGSSESFESDTSQLITVDT